jgi:predicted nucleotidyltransferase
MTTPAWTDADRAAFAHAARARAAESERRRLEWLAQARAEAAACARALAAELGATRIVLFGSVARGDGAPGSDVDLLVSGVAADRWFAAVARAIELVTCAEVDLVPSDKVHPHVAARIAEEGEVLLG